MPMPSALRPRLVAPHVRTRVRKACDLAQFCHMAGGLARLVRAGDPVEIGRVSDAVRPRPQSMKRGWSAGERRAIKGGLEAGFLSTENARAELRPAPLIPPRLPNDPQRQHEHRTEEDRQVDQHVAHVGYGE